MHLTNDLPTAVQRAYAELGDDPAAYAAEAEDRLIAAANLARAGLFGYAIQLAGVAQGFYTLAGRIAGEAG